MGARRLYRTVAPVNAAELPDMDFVQSFDTLYFAHINYDPFKLNREAHARWRFSTIAFGPLINPPTGAAVAATNPNVDAANGGNAYFPQPDTYAVTSVSATTGQQSRASAVVVATNDLGLKRNYNTVTWAADPAAAHYRVFKSHNGGDYGFIGLTTATEFRDDNLGGDLTIGPPEGRNPFAGVGNKPSTVCFFEQRLWWARTLNNPNALYASRSADFENMDVSVPVQEDDGIVIRLVAQGVNEVNQLVPMDSLQAFTSNGIFSILGANEDYLTASPPPRQRRENSRGASRLEPIVIDSIAFYKTHRGHRIRAAGYTYEIDGVRSNDVTIYSEHLFDGFDILAWAYAEEPLSMIWAARSDGALLAFIWQEEHKVWGWTICPLAGNGKVLSLCSIHEFGEDRIYAVIERTIGGVTRRYRERMASARWQGLHHAMHLDCAVTRIFDVPVNRIGGLWHLEGQTVAAFCDGVEYEKLLVSGGHITLPEGVTCSTAHVGLPYDALVETLPVGFQSPRGSTQGRVQQSGKLVLKLVKSRNVAVGRKVDQLYDVKPGRYGDLTDEASLMSGIYPVTTTAVSAYETTVFIRGRIAPMTCTGVYLDADSSGD